MGFRASDLERFRDETVPDLLPERLRLLFVGINPGLWTAATGAHFARPGNRFYPALVAAGVLPHPPTITEEGMSPADRDLLVQRGIGVTNLVRRATARADELSREELRAGAQALAALVADRRPPVVAVVGLTAYRQGFDRPRAVSGEQAEALAGARLWVVPNPSGLNAHDTVDSLARAYAEPARAAGVIE
ncbi:G/U mismatch-specific uracil-DNA glycosylase [Microbacterium sp. SLBN-154]|uniref:mismatch-specific DNA-glycosylase n=1 Tax=Microbacterium sp. SLBN-154 TaxID=2768458 RepID=UPI001154142C|nr:mismatch-specific DNA-glycosylase [Microbacterium sp. SLBN-154]TQK19304.1 G/U mismatch-specific uracil-DNA glycosylase [Microbacterium sp. SLBN-154]